MGTGTESARRGARVAGLLLLASCSRGSEPPPSVRPTADPAATPVARSEAAPDLAIPSPVGGRAGSEQEPTTPDSDSDGGPLVSRSIRERVRDLQESTRAFRELPLDRRTEHLRDIYQHELLELGRTLASIRRGRQPVPHFLNQAVSAFEELAFEAGEDSDLGVRAYQHLADLKREAGLLDEAEAYEEALQRLLDERDD